jgi:hypothetical protein
VLADMARTDRHNHRRVATDTETVQAVKVLARAHQSMVWSRNRQTNVLRSTLREFYPAALAAFDDLDSADALERLVLEALRPHPGVVLQCPRCPVPPDPPVPQQGLVQAVPGSRAVDHHVPPGPAEVPHRLLGDRRHPYGDKLAGSVKTG